MAAAAVEEAFGPIDAWVNNAMVSVFSPIKEMTPDEYRRVTEVTYFGYVYGTLVALRPRLRVAAVVGEPQTVEMNVFSSPSHHTLSFREYKGCEIDRAPERRRCPMFPIFGWTMFGSGRVTCGVCRVAVPKPQAKRTLARGLAAVCNACYERWSRSGRICVKCQTSVKGPQQPGFFTERHGLGHADCGGALLAV